MRYSELLTEAPIDAISPQQAVEGGMWGPFYHGTEHDLGEIIRQGVDPKKSIPMDFIDRWEKPLGTSNGYPLTSYGLTGIAPPIHHLGFGFYGSKAKATATKFAGGTTKGMRAFYLDSNNVEEINFGSTNTMMRWWRENGYNMTSEATQKRDVRAWKQATMNLTTTLAAKFDAVYFLGKNAVGRLLDGDQICVYAHAFDKIKVLDPKLAKGLEIGAKVTHTQVIPERFKGKNSLYVDELRPDDYGHAGKLMGWRGIFRADEDRQANLGRYPSHFIPPPNVVGVLTSQQTGNSGVTGQRLYSVKWTPGGEMYNYSPDELQPYERPARKKP